MLVRMRFLAASYRVVDVVDKPALHGFSYGTLRSAARNGLRSTFTWRNRYGGLLAAQRFTGNRCVRVIRCRNSRTGEAGRR